MSTLSRSYSSSSYESVSGSDDNSKRLVRPTPRTRIKNEIKEKVFKIERKERKLGIKSNFTAEARYKNFKFHNILNQETLDRVKAELKSLKEVKEYRKNNK